MSRVGPLKAHVPILAPLESVGGGVRFWSILGQGSSIEVHLQPLLFL